MFFQDIGVFMRLNRCHIKSSISYCGIIDPGRFNQPLTNLKNHDILSFPPPKKQKQNKTHPAPKQLQSSASIKHVTSQERGQMGERRSSWMSFSFSSTSADSRLEGGDARRF